MAILKVSPLEHFTNHFGLVSDFLSEGCTACACRAAGLPSRGHWLMAGTGSWAVESTKRPAL